MQLEGPTAAGLMYSDTGGDSPVVVPLHGVLMNGTLWDTVVDGLEDRYRCIVPELPFGAHTTPMPDDADLSLPVLATMIAEFLTELDLRHVTLVCNDWGGAQLVISPGGTDRVANLVLVSCEAFDKYLRTVPKPQQLLEWADQQRSFAGPVLIIWVRDDKLMPPAHAERLADHFQNTQLVWIDDSRTLIPIDQPKLLIDQLHTFRVAER